MIAMRSLALVVISAAASGEVVAQQQCASPARLIREAVYDDSAEPFASIRAVALDGRGQVIVAESDGNSLKVFRENGSFIGLWGRSGEGPGEFRTVATLIGVNDSVWVFDSQLRRGTYIRSDGSAGLITPFRQTLPAPHTLAEAYPLGAQYVILPALMSDALARPEGYRRPLWVSGAEPASRPRELVRPLDMRGLLAPLRLPGDRLTHIPLPTTRFDRIVPAPGARTVVSVHGEIGDSGRRFILITRLNARGDTLTNRRLEVPRAPVEQSFVDQELSALVARIARMFPSETAARRAIAEVWRADAHFWPVAGAFVDYDDRTWVRVNPATNVWMVVNSAGTVAACVEAQPQLRITTARGSSVWAVSTDRDGVQQLHRLRLTR